MQMQSDFFYVYDFTKLITQVIQSIAITEHKDIFIANCNKLLDYLNSYRRTKPGSGFSKCIKNLITTNKLTDIDDCCAFIDQLKEIPTNTYSEWRQNCRDMLDFIDTETAKKTKTAGGNTTSTTNALNTFNYQDISEFNRENRQGAYKVCKRLNPKRNQINRPLNLETQIIPRTYTNKIRTPDNPNENVDKSIRGLPNVGNACYMISTLQCLYDDINFRRAVLKSQIFGPNAKKMQAVKEIFEYLDGKRELTCSDFDILYKTLGYSGSQEDSLDFKGDIEKLFDKTKQKKNQYKIDAVIMNYDIPKTLDETEVIKNRVNRYDWPNAPGKKIIDINIYRTQSETKDEVNKNPMAIPETMTFGNNIFALKSINTHLGSSWRNGHYISYVKKGDKWIKRNNNHITVHDWKNIKEDIECNCTFLRYERIS